MSDVCAVSLFYQDWEVRCVCCISILTGLPTLLGEITCVSSIIIITRLPTLLGEADVCAVPWF